MDLQNQANITTYTSQCQNTERERERERERKGEKYDERGIRNG
jgi:hypothetical protein